VHPPTGLARARRPGRPGGGARRVFVRALLRLVRKGGMPYEFGQKGTMNTKKGMNEQPAIPLPRGWTGTVNSAVVQVNS
jgi:hypothetical protein